MRKVVLFLSSYSGVLSTLRLFHLFVLRVPFFGRCPWGTYQVKQYILPSGDGHLAYPAGLGQQAAVGIAP